MGQSIDTITLKGFKSIQLLDNFKLGAVNILIGANGSGKSNFVSFFSLLREMVEGRLEKAVNKAGGADAHLFLGPKVTDKIVADLKFGVNGYKFSLEATADNRLIFGDERIEYTGRPPYDVNRSIGSGHSESKLTEQLREGEKNKPISQYIYAAISRWVVYHFHDTSDTAAMRRTGSVRDNERFRPDAGNLAAFLFHLREEKGDTYSLIVDTVRLVAPFLRDFKLRPKKSNGDEIIELEWEQKDSDYPFHASQLSDGTLRFIALATALLQPSPPATILIDEPELGLHPQALDVLANLILQAQKRTQLIVSTQSAPLLNAFEPDQIVVIDREEGASRFRRLETDDLATWFAEDYTLGELWQKNVYGGDSYMSRVIAVVEGQTEQGFVRDILAPFLAAKNVYMTARLVGKPGHKGGDCRYARAKQDVLLLLRQESDTVVTTMFDFYALPDSWPGRTEARQALFSQKAGIVETAVKEDILGELGTSFDESRFHPYIQMHEFEALLFSQPATICAVLRSPKSEGELQAIRDAFQNPEEINDSSTTAPSKQLVKVFTDYRKRIHGLIAAQRIGIDAMRRDCPHFAEWLKMLELVGRGEVK